MAARQAARCCSDKAIVVGTGVVATGVVAAEVVTAGVVIAGVVIAGIVTAGVVTAGVFTVGVVTAGVVTTGGVVTAEVSSVTSSLAVFVTASVTAISSVTAVAVVIGIPPIQATCIPHIGGCSVVVVVPRIGVVIPEPAVTAGTSVMSGSAVTGVAPPEALVEHFMFCMTLESSAMVEPINLQPQVFTPLTLSYCF